MTTPVSKIDFEFENYNLTLQQLKGFPEFIINFDFFHYNFIFRFDI